MAGPSRVLARFVTASRWEDIPEAVRHEGRRSLFNYVASALGGCRDPAVDNFLAVLGPFSTGAAATVVGRPERLDLLHAAFLNAVSANVFDFDDTHLRTVIHPSAPIAPALFALAETRRLAGTDLLHAFILGVEAACRLGNAVSPGHYRRGWHITSTCGVVGAAVATGKLLGLDEQQMLWALGNAATQAAGLIENLGSMSKSINLGNAVRNGMLAALYARAGVWGPEQPLDGPRGWIPVFGDHPAPAELTDDLGKRWESAANTYKPFPCGIVLHPVLEACLTLRREHGLAPARIARVEVFGHPLLFERTDRPDVMTGREASVSLQHSVAAAFCLGAAGLPQYRDEVVRDPALLAFRNKVTGTIADDIAVEGARVLVETTEGVRLATEVTAAYGSRAHPMSDADLEQKLRDMCAFAAPFCDAGALTDALWRIDEGDPAAVMRLAAP